jgi:adiponectin receptor
MNHSSKMDKLGMQLDFQGVILLMWGATVPMIYYGFDCHRNLRWIYWSLLSTILHNQPSVAHSVHPALRIRHSLLNLHLPTKIQRSLSPSSTSSNLRQLCLLINNPSDSRCCGVWLDLQSQRMGLKWVLATLGLNTLGAAAYAVKVSMNHQVMCLYELC